MRGPIGWIIGALIGATIGAAIWAAIAYFTGYEVGYIAILVGALAGIGTHVLGQDEGPVPGVLAAAAAILAIAVGKYAVISISVDEAFGPSGDLRWTADDGIAAVADSYIAERESRGETIEWPELGEDHDWENASAGDTYPADIWKQASEGWDRMPASDQQRWIDHAKYEHENMMREVGESVKSDAFAESFSPFDLLWLALAVGAAFKLGSGFGDDE